MRSKIVGLLLLSKPTVHKIAIGFATVCGLYLTNDSVKHAVDSIVAPHKRLSMAVYAVTTIYMLYVQIKKENVPA